MESKNRLYGSEVYHIVSRSIAKYQIFNSDQDYCRFINLMRYYQIENPPIKYSMFLLQKGTELMGFEKYFKKLCNDDEHIVEIIAFCLMPTHIHLVLKQLKEGGISSYMRKILDSYTRYFNSLHKRKGPLWESRFKSILVENDEQLNHLVRYIHLNPTSAGLVKKPEQWQYSSYLEYIKPSANKLTNYKDLLEITPKNYQKFVNDRKDYQRNLAFIKKIIYPNL